MTLNSTMVISEKLLISHKLFLAIVSLSYHKTPNYQLPTKTKELSFVSEEEGKIVFKVNSLEEILCILGMYLEPHQKQIPTRTSFMEIQLLKLDFMILLSSSSTKKEEGHLISVVLDKMVLGIALLSIKYPNKMNKNN